MRKIESEADKNIIGCACNEIRGIIWDHSDDEREENWRCHALDATTFFDAALYGASKEEVDAKEQEWNSVLEEGVNAGYQMAIRIQEIFESMKQELN